VSVVSDPYATLGVSATVSDAELRSAYRKLVLLHHPDHNGGSAESARRFEAVQEAYAQARRLRSVGGGAAGARAAGAGTSGRRATGSTRPAEPRATDPDLDVRLADIERELREANEARERARRAAREAAAAARAHGDPTRSDVGRATDEELGYVTTDDSFTKILSDVRDELFGKVEEARESHTAKRVADLIDEVAAKLRGE
jgi:curved DNA-binding protein CbpA